MLLIITGLTVEIYAGQEMTHLAITLAKKMGKNSANLAGLEITVKKVFIAHYPISTYIVKSRNVIQRLRSHCYPRTISHTFSFSNMDLIAKLFPV